jgi:hypothetical protein
MTDIRCGRKEIDLLAINPNTHEKYHIEACVHTTQSFTLETVNSLRKKFEDPIVKEKIHRIFRQGKYTRILVVWNAKDKAVIEASKRKFNIKILPMETVLATLEVHLMSEKHPKGSRDDILRTMEFIALVYNSNIRKR